jgi:hypothetical protein
VLEWGEYMDQERNCIYTIINLGGVKQEYQCDPAKSCLRKRVWTEGLNNVAAQLFDKDVKVIQARVKGTCRDVISEKTVEPFPHH